MRLVTGFTFGIGLFLSLCALVVLKVVFDRSNGLTIPSKSTILNQIITSYLPVAFATLLEPFWTLLNRTLRVLKPLDALRQGRGQPSKTMCEVYINSTCSCRLEGHASSAFHPCLCLRHWYIGEHFGSCSGWYI